ncbi:MAG: hypothetical protein WCB96_08430 [Candidatus Aminicenantales bacterium]
MKKYWDKINLAIVNIIRLRAKIAAGMQREAYIESAILQASLTEAALRTAITTKVGSRKKAFKKYWDGDAYFSRLIDYFELTGGRPSIIKRLREYNKNRNKIVRHILEYKNIHELVSDAKKNYSMGKRLVMQLSQEAGLSEKK